MGATARNVVHIKTCPFLPTRKHILYPHPHTSHTSRKRTIREAVSWRVAPLFTLSLPLVNRRDHSIFELRSFSFPLQKSYEIPTNTNGSRVSRQCPHHFYNFHLPTSIFAIVTRRTMQSADRTGVVRPPTISKNPNDFDDVEQF